jgi:hypothetical protein
MPRTQAPTTSASRQVLAAYFQASVIVQNDQIVDTHLAAYSSKSMTLYGPASPQNLNAQVVCPVPNDDFNQIPSISTIWVDSYSESFFDGTNTYGNTFMQTCATSFDGSTASCGGLYYETGNACSNITCKTTLCGADVEWPTYVGARASMDKILHFGFRPNCGREVSLTPPTGSGTAPYQSTVYFRCQQARIVNPDD